MVVEKASGRDSPLRQGAKKSSWILPISHRRWRWLAVCFEEKLIGSLGFSHRGEYIGGRAASGGGLAGLTPWWRGPGAGHATLG
jgi:hypothetical protein